MVFLLVVNHLHITILLNPQLAHNDIVDAARGVGPRVGLVVPGPSAETETRQHGDFTAHSHTEAWIQGVPTRGHAAPRPPPCITIGDKLHFPRSND